MLLEIVCGSDSASGKGSTRHAETQLEYPTRTKVILKLHSFPVIALRLTLILVHEDEHRPRREAPALVFLLYEG